MQFACCGLPKLALGCARDVLTHRRSSDTSSSPAAPPAPTQPPPLPVYPPTRTLLAAFAGDLPVALLAETYYRAQQVVSLHSDRIPSELHDLLQVRFAVGFNWSALHLACGCWKRA